VAIGSRQPGPAALPADAPLTAHLSSRTPEQVGTLSPPPLPSPPPLKGRSYLPPFALHVTLPLFPGVFVLPLCSGLRHAPRGARVPGTAGLD
jgi:hypothetical protein